jgi:hypothetical protein
MSLLSPSEAITYCDPSENVTAVSQTKSSCIGRIPTEIFRIFQSYVQEIDYRNLMNTDSSTFKSVKSETIRYSLKCFSMQLFDQSILDLLKNVKDRTKQISIRLISMNVPELHHYLMLCQSVNQIHIYKPVQPLDNYRNFIGASSTLSVLILTGIKEGGDFYGNNYHALQHLELVECNFLWIRKLGRRRHPLKMVIIRNCPKLIGFGYLDQYVTTLKLDYLKSTRLIYKRCLDGCELIINATVVSVTLLEMLRFAELKSVNFHCHFPDVGLDLGFLQSMKTVALHNSKGRYCKGALPCFHFAECLHLSCFTLSAWNKITTLENLLDLKLVWCSEMVILPDMPRVNTIVLLNCWDLEVIPRLPLLRKICIEDCMNLHTVSYCPNLKVRSLLDAKD